MMNRVALIGLFLLLSSLVNELEGMVYDNRFMPLIPRTYSRTWRKPSHVNSDLFVLIGNKAFDNDDNDEADLFGIFGQYDENCRYLPV